MKMRFHAMEKLVSAVALAAAPIALAPAFAATPAQVTPGMQVVDPSGGAVGSIVSVKGDSLVLKTAKHEVQLPLSAFTADKGKLLFGLTAAQLDAQADQQAAANSQAIAVGAAVFGSDGTPAGTIEAIEDPLVTIKLADGQSVRVQRSGLAPNGQGVVIGVTTAKLNAMAAQATASAPAPQTDGQ
jgi:preprotein translocase subunit YajC